MAQRPVAGIDRKLRSETRKLLREAKAGLSRHGSRLPGPAREEIEQRVDALEGAVREDDGDAMRVQGPVLDSMLEEQFAFLRKSTLREYAESIGIAVVIAVVLRLFVVEAFKIPSGSMIPTMEIGDHIFVNKFLYGIRIPVVGVKFFQYRKPEPGEVIVFEKPHDAERRDFIKRIVAVAGDTVEMRCGRLFINGAVVERELLDADDRHWDKQQDNSPDDFTDYWYQISSSRYREVLGENHYEALYEPERPRLETRLKRTGVAHAGMHLTIVQNDFPGLAAARFPARAEAIPRCSEDGARAGLIGCYEDVSDEAADAAMTGELEDMPAQCRPQRHYVVPAAHVFAMGDNRDNSSDSRRWGPVPLDNIKGKALFIWWSANEQLGRQWDRIGRVVQ